jgi:signal transduction histidine kinase
MKAPKIMEQLLKCGLYLQKGYPILAVGVCFFFLLVTITGIRTQAKHTLWLPLLHGNIAIIVVSVLFVMTMTQYFLLKNKAFWYYSLYLLCNVVYFHYAVFLGKTGAPTQVEKLRLFPPIIHFLFGYCLIGGYLLYNFFVIHFLKIATYYTDFYQRFKIYIRLYGVILILYTVVNLLVVDEISWIRCLQGLLGCCIPIGAYTLFDCLKTLEGRLARIFLTGACFYFGWSSIGFLYEIPYFHHLWRSPWIQNSVFFIQIGVIMEVVCFSAGLSYQMQLIGIERNKMEEALFLQKVEALEFEKAWLNEQKKRLSERKRIMADLHDDVQGTLAGISIFASIAQTQVQATHPQTAHIIENIGDKARLLIDIIKQIIGSSTKKDTRFEDIMTQMQQYVQDLSAHKNTTIDFQVDTDLNNLNFNIQKNKEFYLIFKEAAYNASKYAHATHLQIRLEKQLGQICLTIVDNGQGFEQAKVKTGSGLRNMQQRANRLGGVLEITSTPNEGTTVLLRVPI